MLFASTARRLLVGLAAVVLAVGLASVPSEAEAATAGVGQASAQRAISCSTASSGTAASFYPGPSASYVYDRTFSKSFAIPGLSTHTPQGIGTWTNWDGAHHDLLLVTAYRPGANAWVYGINAATGHLVHTAQIASTHAGGIAVVGSWVFISGAGQSIRKYHTSQLRAVMNGSATSTYMKEVGTARKVHGASFITTYGGYLYAGLFNDTARDRMYKYKVASTGTLTTIPGGYEIPTKTQGAVVTSGRFIFSTSYIRTNRGNIYVVKTGYSSLDHATLRCFRSPSMNEGVTVYGGRLYELFESGSYEYRSPPPLNRISNAHRASLATLVAMV